MICDSMFYAERDGIEVRRVKLYNGEFNRYMVPCPKCGRVVPRGIYNPEKIYLCDYCKKVQATKKKAVFEDAYSHIRTPREQQFDKAVALLKMIYPKRDFDSSIAMAEQRAELYGSIPEVMAAVMLLQAGYSIIPQQKIGRLTVDFCIPKHKLVIEIDGSLYHQSREKSLQRDLKIQLALGFDWEIIHLPAEGVAKKPDGVIDGINAILQHRGKEKGLE